jgi:RNA polymerase sigma-70 factor (ECF subfamily)
MRASTAAATASTIASTAAANASTNAGTATIRVVGGAVARTMAERPDAPLDAGPLPPATHVAPRDLDAFLADVERRAFRLAELSLGSRDDALDAVQEAMIRLVRYRARPASEWSPLFWGILRRQLTDRHRRQAVRQRVFAWLGRADDAIDPAAFVPDPHADPARHHTDAAAFQALGRALRLLPRRQRECFLLRELQGLDVAETAAAMGCSTGSVKTHLSRALAALRGHLEDWR